MASQPTGNALPVHPDPLTVEEWIIHICSTASGSEAVEIASAIKKEVFEDPQEIAGLLCDDNLTKEIIDNTRNVLNLRHRSILSALARACKEEEADKEHQRRTERAGSTSSSGKNAKKDPAEPQLSASDIKKIFEESNTAPPCVDLLASPELFRKLTKDNERTQAAFPGRTPFTMVDLYKEAKPLGERDLARPANPKGEDFWETIQSIFELKEDEKREPRKRVLTRIVMWNRYWFTYAYAAIACKQITMKVATAH